MLLSVALGVTCVGWFRRRVWGWWLAVVILSTQILGDLLELYSGRILEGTIGVLLAGALVFYLLREKVRGAFGKNGE